VVVVFVGIVILFDWTDGRGAILDNLVNVQPSCEFYGGIIIGSSWICIVVIIIIIVVVVGNNSSSSSIIVFLQGLQHLLGKVECRRRRRRFVFVSVGRRLFFCRCCRFLRRKREEEPSFVGRSLSSQKELPHGILRADAAAVIAVTFSSP